jgi:hypothetical protein
MNRAQRLALLAGGLTAAVTIYACSNSSSPTTPPVNEDSGAPVTDSGTIVVTDGGDSGTTVTTDGGDAGSLPLCSSLPGTVKYIVSADTQEAMLDNVGRQLRDKANVTIAFLLTGSCAVTAQMYGGTAAAPGVTAFPAQTQMLYIPSTAEDPTWTPTPGPGGGGELTCTTGTATPKPDFGIAALFPASCAGYSSLPQGTIKQYVGPTQAYTFVVPTAEFTGQQTSIAAEEAYYTFGWGADNAPITPNLWNDPTQFYLRPSGKSTLISTALNIQLPVANMVDVGSDGGTVDGRNLVPGSGGVVTDITTATSNKAIGILGDEVYDSDRTGLSVLAFQDYGQDYAYFPDSTITSYDRQNIRDGHYGLWSPDVYMAPSTSGAPTDPIVGYILDIVLGNPDQVLPDGGTNPIDAVAVAAAVGLTPSCAMQVTRAYDGAPLTPYTPAAPCTCAFLNDIVTQLGATAATLPASCTTCTTSATCSDAGPGALIGCFNGFCETAPVPLADAGAGVNCNNATIINACTNAQTVSKTVTYPDDGGLEPNPPQ